MADAGNATKAMAFLDAAQRSSYELVRQLGRDAPVIENYWLVQSSKWFGLVAGRGGSLIAACAIRATGFTPIPLIQVFYIAVQPAHRRKGLATKLLQIGFNRGILEPSGALRYSLASMPDSEPGLVRKFLTQLGCKPTHGINTDGLPMLYSRHPLFEGDDSPYTSRNYQIEPPEQLEIEI